VSGLIAEDGTVARAARTRAGAKGVRRAAPGADDRGAGIVAASGSTRDNLDR